MVHSSPALLGVLDKGLAIDAAVVGENVQQLPIVQPTNRNASTRGGSVKCTPTGFLYPQQGGSFASAVRIYTNDTCFTQPQAFIEWITWIAQLEQVRLECTSIVDSLPADRRRLQCR